ncbi:Ig-like domain-containing protein [bacterium]|nr:Ig-like domain-containing protein [bacterium]
MKSGFIYGLCAILAVLALVICLNINKFIPEESGPGSGGGAAAEEAKPKTGIEEEKERPFDFTLSVGEEAGSALKLIPPAAAETLSGGRAEEILRRLPPLPAGEELSKDFNVREKSLPAPRGGETVKVPFPDPEELKAINALPEAAAGEDSEPASLLRYSPEGEVGMVQGLTLSFSKPMISLQGAGESRAKVPASIKPEVKGSWRWLGAKTAIFEPEGRYMPMSSEYTVSVDANLQDASGKKIDKAYSFNFSTETLKVIDRYPAPGQTTGASPLFAMVFNQRVEAEKLQPFVSVDKSGLFNKKKLAAAMLKLADLDNSEAEGASAIKTKLKGVPADRYIIFKLGGDLEPDAKYRVTVQAGAVSAEGARKTADEQSYTFSTYHPLKVVDTNGSLFWKRNSLSDNDRFALIFNNELDVSKLPADKYIVSISPEPKEIVHAIYGRRFVISADTKCNTTYKIRLNPEITDIYGQKLGKSGTFSFKVGAPVPYMYAPGSGVNLLDPDSNKVYSVYTANIKKLKAKLFKADIADWLRFKDDMLLSSVKSIESYKGLGKEVWFRTINIDCSSNELTQTEIDISEGVKDGGLAMLVLEYDRGKDWKENSIVWLQSSNLALDTYADSKHVYGVVTNLKTGLPQAGAKVYLGGKHVLTDKNGVAVFEDAFADSQIYASASYNGDWVYNVEGVSKRDTYDGFLWYVFNDRGLYRPNEKVSIKGWLGRLNYGPDNNAELVRESKNVRWELKDSRDAKISEGSLTTDAYGGFSLELVLPDNINLGGCQVYFELPDGKDADDYCFTHRFEVQEFRRPEFEVTATASEPDNIMGKDGSVTAKASYFSGGGVSNAEIAWNAKSAKAFYAPPGWDGFVFGRWRPSWRCWWSDDEESKGVSHSLNSVTDAMGKSTLNISFGKSEPPAPVSINVEGAVSDLNRQRWACNKSIIVHPSEVYIGVKSDIYRYAENKPYDIEYIVADIGGKAAAGRPIKLKWDRLEYTYDSEGELTKRVMETFSDSAVSETKSVKRSVVFPKAGLWRLTAETQDKDGRRSQTVMDFCAGSFAAPLNVKNDIEVLTLIPDKDEYEPGETAKILVQCPFKGVSGMYCLARDGFVKNEPLSINGSTAELKIPIDSKWLPNVNLSVAVNGQSERLDAEGRPVKGTARPACAKGALNLKVSLKEKKLDVKVRPDNDKLRPGDTAKISVEVKDCGGKPVPDAQTAVVVVDDSVWALCGHEISDPISAFYCRRSGDIAIDLQRATVLLNNQKLKRKKELRISFGGDRRDSDESDEVNYSAAGLNDECADAPGNVCYSIKMSDAAREDAAMAPAEKKAARKPTLVPSSKQDNSPIAVRSNFDALALFKAAAVTDAAGKASLSVKLPDNLTRYRIVAVAADKETRFGKDESTLTACLPLMVRPNAPRFLNFGDKFELPIVLHNQTDKPMRVEVAAAASNLKFSAGNGAVCEIPADSRREVRLPMEADQAGKGIVQIAAVSGSYADSHQCTIPVYTPCTTEGFATYGVCDGTKTLVQPVSRPKDAYTQFGGLEITTSSTALQELADAVIYLYEYPFECSEQLASKIIAASELFEVLNQFKTKDLPSAKEVRAQTQRDIDRMLTRQDRSGGFGIWVEGEDVLPYITVHCAQSLIIAKKHGYDVPQENYDRAMDYLRNIDRHIPSSYSHLYKLTVEAYADNVLWQAEKADYAAAVSRLKKEKISELPIGILGWYLPVIREKNEDLAREIRRVLNNSISETASTANIGKFTESDGYLILESDMKSEALVLSALIVDNPKADIIPKVVKTLQSGRRRGHWGNTHNNAHVIMALNKYFNTYESVTPDFILRMWLGEQYVGSHQYKGRQNINQETFVPMNYVGDNVSMILDKQGQGRLYYRLGLSYALKDLAPKALEAGFTVARTYEGVDDPKDAVQQPDGSWKFKLGSRIRCKTEMAAPARRAHVALAIPIPAGGEILNGALKMTESLPETEKHQYRDWWCWRPTWFDHQNLRDERAEAFRLILPAGKYDYSFIFRATVPGTFVVPPAKAEEMYSPETFGRSEGVKVVIK